MTWSLRLILAARRRVNEWKFAQRREPERVFYRHRRQSTTPFSRSSSRMISSGDDPSRSARVIMAFASA